VLEVSPPPSVVLLASPPDWDSRFLARTLSDVARVPVRTFVGSEPGGGGERGWRDGASLTPVSGAEVARAVAGARLVVRGGDPAKFDRFSAPGAVLTWRTARGQEGDWYVQLPGPSALAGALGGIAWDSLAPAAAVSDLALPSDSTAVVVLTARLARRGAPRPVLVLSERAGKGGVGSAREATVAAAGLFRWAFRGGASDGACGAAAPARAVRVRDTGRPGARRRGGGDVLLRMASGDRHAARPSGQRGGAGREHGAARAVVDVRDRHRGVRDGVGVAAAT